jgi:hypothetical protein
MTATIVIQMYLSRCGGKAQVHEDIVPEDARDQLVAWRMGDPRYEDRATRVKGLKMQRQWTIEARADFADRDKNDAITQAIREAAVHVHATMALLSDKGVSPQVVAFSDDFFAGHEEIGLHENKLGKAIHDHTGMCDEAPVSDELLAAARDMQHDKT